MKNFVIIFPFAQNVHLIKDLGQVGNFLRQENNYTSTLVCYRNSKEYSYLTTETKHLNIDFIENSGKRLFLEKAVLQYLKKHAKEINVLNLYHLTKESIYYGLYYLFLNKNGKIYLKMDVYNDSLTKDIVYSKKCLFQQFHQKMEKRFLKKLTVISVENPTALDLITKRYPILQEKAMLLPNGINNDFLPEIFPNINSYKEKENIILSVGRIGAKDKNFEMLLNAFIKANLPDWKLIFVGSITNNFKEKVEKGLKKYPQLENNIELTGNIENRKILYEYYNRSKICCLTSPFESFGITFIEGMYFGNYVIGTKGMSSFNYITNNQQLGMAIDVNNEGELIKLLEKITSDEEKLKYIYIKAQQYVKGNFYWSEIVKPLVEKLNQITKDGR